MLAKWKLGLLRSVNKRGPFLFCITANLVYLGTLIALVNGLKYIGCNSKNCYHPMYIQAVSGK